MGTMEDGENFSSLQSVSRLQRFGPSAEDRNLSEFMHAPRRDKLSVDELGDCYNQARTALSQQGFEENNETSSCWLGFQSPDAQINHERWSGMPDAEHMAIVAGDTKIPSAYRDLYKLCFNVEPSKLSQLIELLGEDFPDVPFYGKLAKPNVLKNDDIPSVVLYFDSTRRSRFLDIAVNLGYSVGQQLGSTDKQLDKALEVVPNSGVHLTQGTYSKKQEAEFHGSNLYSPDGSVFATEYSDIVTYLGRRRNQFVIDENLYLFTGMSPSEKLEALHLAAYDGVETGIAMGVREKYVRVGDYLAPRPEDLNGLLNNFDALYKDLVGKAEDRLSYEQALRAASFVYMSTILLHPFEDGNGQSCCNLVSSCLYDLGFKRIYFDFSKGSSEMRSVAFTTLVREEAPTTPCTRPLSEYSREAWVESAKLANVREMFSSIFNDASVRVIGDFIRNGDYEKAEKTFDNMPRQHRDYGRSFISRMQEVYLFMKENLRDEPLASKALSFEDLSESHGIAQLY